jgi:hypothetical protein
MLQTNDIIERLSPAERAAVATRIAKIERALERRGKIASWLLWMLDDPRLQQRIREICE